MNLSSDPQRGSRVAVSRESALTVLALLLAVTKRLGSAALLVAFLAVAAYGVVSLFHLLPSSPSSWAD